MIFIDTHTHLYLEQFENDLEDIIYRAIDKGVVKMVLPNIDSSSIDKMLIICKKYPANCFPAIGLHPSSVKKNYSESINEVKDWLIKEKFCAIGEIGIDLYWDKTYKKEQLDAFNIQLQLSIDHELPVIIHSRNSFNEILEVLSDFKEGELQGVFHCFTGTISQAEQIISTGMKLGIGGVVTFKNAGLARSVEAIDLSHIVLETDSPYLAPVPKRGKRNECSYLLHIAAKIAEIKKISVEEVANVTTKNAIELFKL